LGLQACGFIQRQVIAEIQHGQLQTWSALLSLNVEYFILRAHTETATFGYLAVVELSCNKQCLGKFILTRSGLAKYQKIGIHPLNCNIFKSTDLQISVEEVDADFEQSAYGPIIQSENKVFP
jgi:hypothetical protein